MAAWLACIAFVAAFATVSAGTAQAADPPWAATDIDMPVIQVGPHSYYVQGLLDEATAANEGFMSNAGFVITGDGVIVFDTLGSPALADRMLAEIRKRTSQPVKLVIISHYHADHFYGIPALRAAGAKVWANALARAYIESDAAQTRLAERRDIIGPYLGRNFTLPLPDRWLAHDESMQMGEVTLRVLHLGPAHTPEDEGLLVEPDGVLFSGDVVYTGRVPFIGNADTRAWLASIDRLLAIDARVMVPGHGPASHDPHKDARLTRDYLLFLRQQMGAAAQDLDTFDEAYAKVDWSRFSAIPTFDAANRANAYSVFLEMEEELLHGR